MNLVHYVSKYEIRPLWPRPFINQNYATKIVIFCEDYLQVLLKWLYSYLSQRELTVVFLCMCDFHTPKNLCKYGVSRFPIIF